MHGVPRFMLGVYDSGGGYSTDHAFWEDQIFSPMGSRGLQGFPLNLYLNYFLGAMPIDSTNALLDVLNNHGMMYLQTGNCSLAGSWTRYANTSNSFSIASQTYVQQFAQHTAAAGYYIMDECAESLIAETEQHHQQLMVWDPQGLTFSAIVAGVPPGNQLVGDPSLWHDASDVLGTDPYPLYGPEPAAGYTHFIVGDFTSKLRAVARPDRPVWSVLQFFKSTTDSRLPTPGEMRAHAVMAIVEGAQGIFWWDIGDNGIRLGEDAATVSTYMGYLKTLTTELAGLEPALLADPTPGALVGNSTKFSDPVAGRISQLDHNIAVEWLFSRILWYRAEKAALQGGDTTKSGGMLDGAASVRTLTKLINGVGYVFAYNYTNQSQPVTFTWHHLVGSVTENKTGGNPPVSGATWSDTFGPYEARIYVVVDAPILSASPNMVTAGGSATATWSEIANPTAGDWIGLYLPGAVDSAYLTWTYVSCSQTPGSAPAAGSCAFPIPGILAAGTYQLRLFSNNTFMRLATSNNFSVTAGGASLSVSPTGATPGSNVTAAWSGIAGPTAGDWIGLYAAGAMDNAFVAWMYVSCSQTPGGAMSAGACAFPIPGGLAGGVYELRLFSSSSFMRLATSNPVTVTSLAASPNTAAAGDSITATWSGIANPRPMDWIALYAQGATDNAFLAWMYVSCSQIPGSAMGAGSCAFPIPDTLTGGIYELRLFANGGFGRLAISNHVMVTSLNASPNTVKAGDSVTATWAGIASPKAGDWIGLYARGAANTAYLAWMYVSCSQTPGAAMAAGSCAFAIPGTLPGGTHELRLFSNNSFALLALSNVLTVTSLRVAPDTTHAGNSVSVIWNGIVNPTARDWIGLYATGAANGAYLAWMYVSCSMTPGGALAEGACALALPGGFAPGSYELRLFTNDTFSGLATSNTLTVN